VANGPPKQFANFSTKNIILCLVKQPIKRENNADFLLICEQLRREVPSLVFGKRDLLTN